MRKALREIVQIIILALIIFVVVQATMQTFDIKLRSMEPSLEAGERVVVNKAVYFHLSGAWAKLIPWASSEDGVSYLFHPPRRGEVIIFYPPNGSSLPYVKRIIGIPGDVIEIRKGRVYLNHSPTPLNEPYVAFVSHDTIRPVTVPKGHYFVMGDNRANSTDSRSGWMVSYDKVVGKVWFTIWPPSRWGGAPNYSWEPSG
ncbi:MAG TPA: signal peptidase I [Dehalococcoidia bacterium]|jgi:signal peptidase I|nr:signal peptidase I [Dehalococcoidia bacterium]